MRCARNDRDRSRRPAARIGAWALAAGIALPATAAADLWIVLDGPHAGLWIHTDDHGVADPLLNETTDADGEITETEDGGFTFEGSILGGPDGEFGPIGEDVISSGPELLSLSNGIMRALGALHEVETDAMHAKALLEQAREQVTKTLDLLTEGEAPEAWDALEDAADELDEARESLCAVIVDEVCEDDPFERNVAWIGVSSDVGDAIGEMQEAFRELRKAGFGPE